MSCLAQDSVKPTPEQTIRANAQSVYNRYMADFDSDMNGRLQATYQNIVHEALSVAPALQNGYVRDQYQQALADVAQRRELYSQQARETVVKQMNQELAMQQMADLTNHIKGLQSQFELDRLTRRP